MNLRVISFHFRGVLVIDALTVERNHILARALMVGGPSERVLPAQTLSSVGILAMSSFVLKSIVSL